MIKEPNVYAKCLDELMEIKMKKLRFNKYYLEKDKKYILKIGSKKAREIWDKIYRGVMDGYYAKLGPSTCPFCMITGFLYSWNTECEKCFYAKQHGECDSYFDNDFDEISSRKREALTNSWYQRIMKQIEKKYLKEK